jgi:hypothetical protein
LNKKYTVIVSKNIANPIQKGDKTHHQDQLMTLHSLRTIKVSPSKAGNPIPVDVDDEFEFDIVYN